MMLNRWPTKPPRFPVRVPAVTEPVGAASEPEEGEAQNLSQGGMLLRLGKPVTPGVALRVTLRLRRRPTLTLAGTVVWVRRHPDLPGWALGVRFTEELPGEMVVEIADEEYPPWTPPASPGPRG